VTTNSFSRLLFLFVCPLWALGVTACRKHPPPPPPPTAAPSAASAPTPDAGEDAPDDSGALPDPDASLLASLGASNAESDADLDADTDAEAGTDAELPREWRSVKGRHWQIISPPGEPTDETDRAEGNRGACPAGMVEVAGNMVNAWMMDERQQDVCSKWINRNFPERCGEFDRDRWLAQTKDLPRRPMHFCIDRFEYPNKRGEYPVLYVNWNEANDLCADEGKRLCTETEWTFACEGEEAMPYPYGYVRDPEACIVDKTWVPYFPKAFSTPEGTMHELDRLWQGAPSGARPRCKSPFGVYDMTGNVDEWTKSSSPEGRPSVLKGGYWGPVRTRCRPATRAHGEVHAFYQQGLRCCASLSSEAGASEAADP
jgi:formylglycine-generating enzyme